MTGALVMVTAVTGGSAAHGPRPVDARGCGGVSALAPGARVVTRGASPAGALTREEATGC
jgi:hypothetical protein